MSNVRVFITPSFTHEDKGDGGIRRIVEAQSKYLEQYGIDLVGSPYDADITAVHAASQIKHVPGMQYVAHCHGLYWEDYKWYAWVREANRQVLESLSRAHTVTAPSEWVAQVLRRNMWLRPTVINHGIDLEEWPYQEDESRKYVLWNKTRIDAICDPSPLNNLARAAQDTPFVSTFGAAAPNVTLTGRLPYEKAKEHIRKAGVYLCTARETFGVGTLEAMASGVPILGWRWGGQAEFIENGVHGWLAEPGDLNGLIQGLRYVQEHHQELARNCRKLVEDKFSWQMIMPLYANLYKEVYEQTRYPIKVSVVIPSYNLKEFLAPAVQSVLDQEQAPSTEVIIVDDSSTDGSLEVAEQLAQENPQIKVLKNPKNLYLAGALNAGISVAQGEYIVPLDADNMLGPGTLRTLSDSLDNNPSLDIAYGSMELIEPSGKRWVSQWPFKTFTFKDQMSHRNQCPSTSMYRKRIWEQVGGYRRRCRTAEDADFWCRTTSFGAEAQKVTEAVTLIYRNREGSMSRSNKDWPWESWYPWSQDANLAPPYRHPVQATWLNAPVLSVVIPVGPGHEELVIDAVDSIVAQTFQQWEVIVVNDTGKPLPWMHPFVKVLETPKAGSGVEKARNLGIAACATELFIPLDADDYLEPTALGLFYQTWLKYGGYIYSDWFVAETGEAHTCPEFEGKAFLKTLLHAVTCLYPKKAWAEVGGFDESLGAWEDWDFVLSLINAGYCGKRIPKPLLVYRMKAGSRRERLFAARDQAKEAIRSKWGSFIQGEQDIMACGCKNTVIKPASMAYNSNSLQVDSAPGDDMTLVEYTVSSQGTRTFIGKSSGVSYRFGSDPDHRIRYVHNDDLPYLLSLNMFKLYEREASLA